MVGQRPKIQLFATLLGFCLCVLASGLGATPAPVEQLGGKARAASASTSPAAKAATPAVKRRPKVRRSGVNPCMTPDPGWGVYSRWNRNISMGQMLVPERGGVTRSGRFDLIVHFHGHYPIRKEFVKTARGAVLVAIDLGVSSGPYSRAFGSPGAFRKLIASVEREVARLRGRKRARVRKLALSSWSAGYGAVGQILRQPAGRKVDTLILLDSVHAGYVDGSTKLSATQLEPFIKFARKAARGSKLMFQSHSSIIPPGYASTREVSHYMVKRLGGKLRRARRDDTLGLRLFERYDRRGYHVRGYRGNDKPDHCAHLGLMKDVVRVHLKRRWKSPVGRKGKTRLARKSKSRRSPGKFHLVERGQHLSGIAKQYGTTTAALRSENELGGTSAIRVGQELRIPAGAKRPPAVRKKKPKRLTKGERYHVVADGQSLGRIARRYRVTSKALVARNHLKRGGRTIRPGQRLVIPLRAPRR